MNNKRLYFFGFKLMNNCVFIAVHAPGDYIIDIKHSICFVGLSIVFSDFFYSINDINT